MASRASLKLCLYLRYSRARYCSKGRSLLSSQPLTLQPSPPVPQYAAPAAASKASRPLRARELQTHVQVPPLSAESLTRFSCAQISAWEVLIMSKPTKEPPMLSAAKSVLAAPSSHVQLSQQAAIAQRMA